jgi:hypothetical protein
MGRYARAAGSTVSVTAWFMTGIELDNPIRVGLKTTRGSSTSNIKRTQQREDSRRAAGRADLSFLPRGQESIEERIGNPLIAAIRRVRVESKMQAMTARSLT